MKTNYAVRITTAGLLGAGLFASVPAALALAAPSLQPVAPLTACAVTQSPSATFNGTDGTSLRDGGFNPDRCSLISDYATHVGIYGGGGFVVHR